MADLSSVRPALLAAARAATRLEVNLSQALALVGGLSELRILRYHLAKSVQKPFAAAAADDQFRVLWNAKAILRLRASPRAVKVLVDAIDSGGPSVQRTAAMFISEYLLTRPPLRLEQRLLHTLPSILALDDACVASAAPILLQKQYAATLDRARIVIERGSEDARRILVFSLCGAYGGLPLLLHAFEAERSIDLRISIAEELAPVLPSESISDLVEHALDDKSPATRFGGARLLRCVDGAIARRLASRKDPEPMVDDVLQRYRGGGEG